MVVDGLLFNEEWMAPLNFIATAWIDYNEGFGNLSGEVRLGLNKYIDLLTIEQTVYKSI